MSRKGILLTLCAALLAAGCRSEDPPPRPVFDSPEAFLRSLDPGLAAFGPAGYEGLSPEAADYRPENGIELVALFAELEELPEEERAGKVIGLRSGAVYDVSGLRDPGDVRPYQAFFDIPSGVTLAALAGAAAPEIRYTFPERALELLRANAFTTRALLRLGPGSRLQGVRIVGPDVPAHEADYSILPASRFTAVWAGQGAVVVHCEVSRFHWAGISAQGAGVAVRGCDVFDIHAYPLNTGGRRGTAVFSGNRVRWSWHAVAGGGWPETGYVFRHNLVIHEGPGGNAHAVDMHAWRRMMAAGGATYPFISVAGNRIEITGNVFVNDEDGIARWRNQPRQVRAARRHFLERRIPPDHRDAVEVRIRGIPRDLAVVTGNWFATEDPDRAVQLTSEVGEPGRHSRANLWAYDNYHGPEAFLHGMAEVSRARIHFRNPPLEVEQDPETRRWRTDRIAVLPHGAPWQPEVEIEMPPGIQARAVVFRLQEEEQRFIHPPAPGTVVFATDSFEPGVLVFTVEVEDERGIVSRHDLALTLEKELGR